MIIGHRGFAARFPDNSLAGVRAALEAGADGVEIDVRPCASGVWVCHHDRARGGRPVAEWGLAALRRGGVPTLEEVVAAIPSDRWLFVEVKPLAARPLVRGLGALVPLLSGRAATTRILSSSPDVLRLAGTVFPSVARSWVVARLPESIPLGVGLSPRHDLVEELIVAGRQLHPWTVNRAARMRVLARLGVASITTNVVDRAVEVLRG